MLLDEAEGVANTAAVKDLVGIGEVSRRVALHVVSPSTHDGRHVAGMFYVVVLEIVDVGKTDGGEICVETSLCGGERRVGPRPSSNCAHSLLHAATGGAGGGNVRRRHGDG